MPLSLHSTTYVEVLILFHGVDITVIPNPENENCVDARISLITHDE
jgi:uncharacterized protein